jgi:hypothetical protein
MHLRALLASLYFVSFVAIATSPALAQLVMNHEGKAHVRGFHGGGTGRSITRSFQSDAQARAEFDRILSAVGLNWISDRILLRASAETVNAEAGISRQGERFIFYNALFMQKLKERTSEQWSLVSVIAHELGHHVAFHTELRGNDHKYELEADYFSGFVLRRLGATLDQSLAAMRSISPKEATPTHPALDERLQVITLGWTDAGTQGAPRGLSLADKPTPGAVAANVPPKPAPATFTGPPANPTTRVTAFTYFTPSGEIDPGRRDFARQSDGTWHNTWQSGFVDKSEERGRTSIDGCAGTVIGKLSEPDFVVFIPDKGCKSGMMARWRRGEGAWNALGLMKNVR